MSERAAAYLKLEAELTTLRKGWDGPLPEEVDHCRRLAVLWGEMTAEEREETLAAIRQRIHEHHEADKLRG